jgi:CheY-like chemotaxis protein
MSIILVIDDDDAIRDAICESLTDEGFTTVGKANGADALEYLRHSPLPGLILLDLRMPVMNGWEFLDRLRTDSSLAAIPVVAVTADREVSLPALDVQALARKPLKLELLLDLVQHYSA